MNVCVFINYTKSPNYYVLTFPCLWENRKMTNFFYTFLYTLSERGLITTEIVKYELQLSYGTFFENKYFIP